MVVLPYANGVNVPVEEILAAFLLEDVHLVLLFTPAKAKR